MYKPEIDENLFKYLIQGVKDYAIFALDQQGNVMTWNMGAERIKGYKASDIIGKHFSTFYTEAAKNIGHPAYELKHALVAGVHEEQGWRLRKDGTLFWANVVITPIYDDQNRHIGFAKVTQDLTERKIHETQLEEARDEAVLANQLKSKFVANITHEIRTPLTGILGLSQLVAADPDVSADTRDSGERIYTASKQLLKILNELLDFAKLEAGKMEVDVIPYTIASVINEVEGLITTKIHEKALEFSVEIDRNVPEEVNGDPGKVRQILLNLVHNSIKFTESGGIDIAVEKQYESILFSVTDTGIGITEDTQNRLFKPFVQGEQSTARVFGGTGLGLSIAHQFVELMNGEIGLVSEPGKGTTVWFSLPLKPKAA